VLNAYLDEALRTLPREFLDGLAALPLFMSARASVRAHVSAYQGETQLARSYIAAAARHLAPGRLTLTAIGGLSGTGKTTLARLVAPGLGAAPGAVILRTDEIRKRLAGVGPLDPLPREAYGKAMNAEVYGEMLALARRLLKAGRAVVLDAVFLRPDERREAEALAAEAGAGFDGVWLEGAPDLLRARLAGRTGDASEADGAVLDEQLGRDAGPIAWRTGDAADLAAVAKAMTG
jgi:predicted kinase